MLTAFNVNPQRAVEGQLHGSDKLTVPGTIPWLPQIETLTLTNSSEAGTLVIEVTDDLTGQVYSLSVTISGATEATSLDEMLAAWRAHGKLNSLFSVAEDGVLTFTATARHANRSYTFTTDPPGSMVVTPAVAQAAGGSGLRFGRFVVRGDNAGEIEAPGSASVVGDVVGALYRTDGNHFHQLDSELPTDVDALDRGKRYPVLVAGRMWMVAGDAMAPGSDVYMVVESSDADDLGTVRGTPTGSTQVATITPIVDRSIYGFEYGYLGRHYTVVYQPTDATTAVADACAGLEDAADDGSPAGVTVSAGGTTAITLTAAAGTKFDYVRNTHWDLDTEAASTTVSVAAADEDAIDISAIAMVDDESPDAAAGELVLIKIKGLT